MNVLIPLLVGVGILALGARTYAFFISRKLGVDDSKPTPAHTLADGRDYVPSRTHIVFGHHFATIAGAGPIVGPVLALAYGWGAPWLWIVLGCVLFGAVHDMSSMFVSMREGGRSIADMCRRSLGGTGYVLFVAFLILILTLVNAVFLNLSVKALMASYPADLLKLDPGDTLLRQFTDNGVRMGRIGGIATTSVIIITLFAPLLGWLNHKKQWPTVALYAAAAVTCVMSIAIGFNFPVFLNNPVMGISPDNLWRYGMSFYILLACWLPVWFLMQPRDFTNVQILYGGLFLMIAGVLLYGFQGHAVPADMMSGAGAPVDALWPFLFITIACGAISGFHSIAATGTTVKQISRESEVRRIGYNSMIIEGVMALLALLMVATALPRNEYLSICYPAGRDGNPILAFSIATGYMLHDIAGLKVAFGCVLGLLILEGFVVTTLDTAVRLCRYLLEELWTFVFRGKPAALFRNPLFNTLVAVALMLVFAATQGILSLWPIFGAGNQLIAALALVVVAAWLLGKGRSIWFAVVPAVVMTATTFAALGKKFCSYLAPAGSGQVFLENKIPLAMASGLLMTLAACILVIAVRRMVAMRRSTPA